MQPWPLANLRAPVCYLWHQTTCVKGEPERRYAMYSNDLDLLTTNQVWCSRYGSLNVHAYMFVPLIN